MEFNPEDAGHGIIKDGEYNFEVVTAEDTISKFSAKKGNVDQIIKILWTLPLIKKFWNSSSINVILVANGKVE